MGIAKIAIIGRPNVGKSSLFNWLVGERISVVDAVAGVTRDRVSFLLDLGQEVVSDADFSIEKTETENLSRSERRWQKREERQLREQRKEEERQESEKNKLRQEYDPREKRVLTEKNSSSAKSIDKKSENNSVPKKSRNQNSETNGFSESSENFRSAGTSARPEFVPRGSLRDIWESSVENPSLFLGKTPEQNQNAAPFSPSSAEQKKSECSLDPEFETDSEFKANSESQTKTDIESHSNIKSRSDFESDALSDFNRNFDADADLETDSERPLNADRFPKAFSEELSEKTSEYASEERLENISEELDEQAEESSDEMSEEAIEQEKRRFRYIELTDTGGIGIVDRDDLSEDVEQQIDLAIKTADLILFVVDVREGIAALDETVALRLRSLNLPVLLVANKSDDDGQEINAVEFERFGWKVVPVSAKQRRGRVRLMRSIEEALPVSVFERQNDRDAEEPVMRIAIVGRRNVGKSTFVNSLVEEERVIASPIAGTTRDSIDVRFEMNGHSFIAVDTPGFRKRKSVKEDLDFYSTARAERSIRTADVIFMFFDCSQQIGKVDMQLVRLIEESEKPCIFVVNKWDLMEKHRMKTGRWADYLRETFATLWYVPVVFITGLTGKNCRRLIQSAEMLYRQSKVRVSTNALNRLITAAMDYNPPPLFYFRKPKIYFATQVETQPPTILLFCNIPDAFSASYRRFLTGVLRDELPFGEVPLRLIFKKRESSDRTDEIDVHRQS